MKITGPRERRQASLDYPIPYQEGVVPYNFVIRFPIKFSSWLSFSVDTRWQPRLLFSSSSPLQHSRPVQLEQSMKRSLTSKSSSFMLQTVHSKCYKYVPQPASFLLAERSCESGLHEISSRLVFARRPFQNILSRLAFARRGKKSEISKNETRRDKTKFDVDHFRN